jgi:hypothetical protein
MYNLYSIYLGRLARILPLGVITVLASAFSANAEDTYSCTINADKDFYSAICLHATLQQLHNALKKGSQIDLQFPNELANAPSRLLVWDVAMGTDASNQFCPASHSSSKLQVWLNVHYSQNKSL